VSINAFFQLTDSLLLQVEGGSQESVPPPPPPNIWKKLNLKESDVLKIGTKMKSVIGNIL
jgi:hypothetical protein